MSSHLEQYESNITATVYFGERVHRMKNCSSMSEARGFLLTYLRPRSSHDEYDIWGSIAGEDGAIDYWELDRAGRIQSNVRKEEQNGRE